MWRALVNSSRRPLLALAPSTPSSEFIFEGRSFTIHVRLFATRAVATPKIERQIVAEERESFTADILSKTVLPPSAALEIKTEGGIAQRDVEKIPRAVAPVEVTRVKRFQKRRQYDRDLRKLFLLVEERKAKEAYEQFSVITSTTRAATPYALLLKLHGQERDLEAVEKVRRAFARSLIRPTAVFFNSLIHAYYLCGAFPKIDRTVQAMNFARVASTQETTSLLILSKCRTNDVAAAEKLFNGIIESGKMPTKYDLSAMVGLYLNLGQGAKATEILQMMERRNNAPTETLFFGVINRNLTLGQSDRASELLDLMQQFGVKVSVRTYNLFLTWWITRTVRPEKGLRSVEPLPYQFDANYDPTTQMHIFDLLERMKKDDVAFNVHSFELLFMYYCFHPTFQLMRIRKLFQQMQKLNMTPSVNIFNLVLRAFSEHLPSHVKEVAKLMEAYKVKANATTYALWMAMERKDMSHVDTVLKDAKADGVEISAPLYLQYLKYSLNNNLEEKALDILREMDESGVKLDPMQMALLVRLVEGRASSLREVLEFLSVKNQDPVQLTDPTSIRKINHELKELHLIRNYDEMEFLLTHLGNFGIRPIDVVASYLLLIEAFNRPRGVVKSIQIFLNTEKSLREMLPISALSTPEIELSRSHRLVKQEITRLYEAILLVISHLELPTSEFKERLNFYRGVLDESGAPFPKHHLSQFTEYLSAVSEASQKSETQLIKKPVFQLGPDSSNPFATLLGDELEEAKKAPEADARGESKKTPSKQEKQMLSKPYSKGASKKRKPEKSRKNVKPSSSLRNKRY